MAGGYWFIDRLDKGPKAEWQELVVIMAGVFYKSTASLFTKVNAGIDYLCYNRNMKKERISLTNPYLRDRAQRQTTLVASVSSSSAIEGTTTANGVIDEYLQKSGKKLFAVSFQ